MQGHIKEALFYRWAQRHQGELTIPLEVLAQQYLEAGIRLAQPPYPQSQSEADRRVMEFIRSHLAPSQKGQQVLMTAYSIAEKQFEKLEPSNTDHYHVRVYGDGRYEPKQRPEFMMTKLPPNSTQKLQLHSHSEIIIDGIPHILIEYKFTAYKGFTVVTFSPFGRKDIVLSPLEYHGSQIGEWHSIFNSEPYTIYTSDIMVPVPKVKIEPKEFVPKRLPIAA